MTTSVLLQDRIAVVTGGAGTGAGLGQGLVRHLAAAGMRLAILDRDATAAGALAQELGEGRAIACRVDVQDPESLQAAAAQVRKAFGGCNILCAHVGAGMIGTMDATPLAQWRQAMDIMVTGSVATVQAFLPLLRESQGLRRIVLTSSAAALAPGRFQGAYRAAKAALTSLGETLDLELGPEGIGTTIAFPSGMMPPMPGTDVAMVIPDDLPADAAAVAAEMNRDPADLATGYAAAGPILQAVLRGDPYVVTHGATLVAAYRQRHQALEQAFAELARRGGRPG